MQGRGRERRRTREAADVPRPLDDGHLKAEADSEEGDLLLARPLDGEQHALCPAHAESAGDEDSTAHALVPHRAHLPLREQY